MFINNLIITMIMITTITTQGNNLPHIRQLKFYHYLSVYVSPSVIRTPPKPVPVSSYNNPPVYYGSYGGSVNHDVVDRYLLIGQ